MIAIVFAWKIIIFLPEYLFKYNTLMIFVYLMNLQYLCLCLSAAESSESPASLPVGSWHLSG